MAILVSYHGSRRADVDFTKTAAKLAAEWRKAANKAKNAGQPEPSKPAGLRADTLYLKPGSTATVSPEELAAIKADRPDVARFLQVHEDAPKEPRSTKPEGKVKAKPSGSEGAPAASEGGKPPKTKRVG